QSVTMWKLFSRYHLVYVFLFFFFQAEDGIRDGHVTGVQTCALPISRPRFFPDSSSASVPGKSEAVWPSSPRPSSSKSWTYRASRSEERRVGKEYRSPKSRRQ